MSDDGLGDKLRGLVDRAAVLAGAAVTYMVAAAVGVSAAAGELAAAGPAGAEPVVEWLLRAVAWIAAAVAVVRRVTPVEKPLRGLLPPSESG